MMKLSDKEWMAYTVKDLFPNIHATKGKTTGQLIEGNDVPYIAAAKMNNGYASMCSAKEHPEWVSDGNAIVFVQIGDGAAGIAHYVPMDFIGMNGKTSCGYSPFLSKDNGIFIAKCLSSNKAIFSHGHSWTGRRLLNSKAMLPVSDAGDPDYDYMAEYVHKKRKEMLAKYRAFVDNQISELVYKDIETLDEKEWKPISIISIFQSLLPGKSKGLNHLDKVASGGVNYIGATNRGNGVLCYVREDDHSKKMIQAGNCIGFIKNGDGAAGFAIYKSEPFISTSDVIYGYADWLNRYTGLFFVASQDMIEAKYSHGYKRNKHHLAGDKVMLPVNDDGKPDFEYMEQYVKNMMLRKYEQYLRFIYRKEDTRNGSPITQQCEQAQACAEAVVANHVVLV